MARPDLIRHGAIFEAANAFSANQPVTINRITTFFSQIHRFVHQFPHSSLDSAICLGGIKN